MKIPTPHIHIGTSGWSYHHWKDNFYPPKLKSVDWLNYYANSFPTVEVNTTFYHLPLTSTTKRWYQVVPNNFLFSIKASRYITHQKRLNDCEESLKLFFSKIKNLKNKTGPILFQLPPSFEMNVERLNEFVALLPNKYEYVFEFRHPTWYCGEVFNILQDNHIALCITDLNGKLSPEEVTTHFTYIRLHGPKRSYKGSYGPAKLKTWKKKIDRWYASNTSVFCYFDNDEKGYAIEDARSLQLLLNP